MKHVIVAEDDPTLQEVVTVILKRAGYETTVFGNVQSILDNNFIEPDIFIIDKQLPDGDGIDVCRYLKNREFSKNTPVIIFSASRYVDDLAKAAGADDFLEKPFKIRTLLEMIERLIA